MPEPDRSPKRAHSKLLLRVLKVGFSVAMLWVIFHKVVQRDGAAGLAGRLGDLGWGWVGAAVLMQLVAIAFSTVRWQRLLVGQGIRARWRFLFGSIMIARFWGAFTPGGFTGFGGWRIWDVARHTGKTARATATIGVEMILGQLAFGTVVMAASVFGVRFIGAEGVLLVNGFFILLIAAGLTLLARPRLFRLVARLLPAGMRPRVQTLVDAVCAYRGKARLLVQAALLGVGTHAFNNLIYVCAAQALGVQLGVGEVFFASSLQIFATLIPASINGIGLREAAAVALYTSPLVGIPIEVAVLIPVVGFAAEMAVSAVGGLVFVARRRGYAPVIEVEDPDREQVAHEAIAEQPAERWPSRARGAVVGLGAGLLAGVLVGIGEGAVVILSAGGPVGLGVMSYGALAYGLACMLGGALLGAALAWTGRLMKRRAVAAPEAYARLTAFMVACVSFALGAFRVRRDVFHEELVWRSPEGLLVLCGCALAAALLGLLLATSIGWLLRRREMLASAWAFPAVAACMVATVFSAALLVGQPAGASDGGHHHAAPPEGAGNVLMVVVDTLRADHLPAYGYGAGSTPGLDAFAQDAIRFDMAFANASWTRPSFASILTGRYPSSHGVMSKADQLPSELVTLPEALSDAGVHTVGFVTNYNIAPYFNFQQGFDEFHYLEPEFVLGADDTAAKLLLVQFLRQSLEKVYAHTGHVTPGSAYQDAETVNGELRAWLDRAPEGPWFLFAAYMDPHDPYFEHPYTGDGYARAAHQHPALEEAAELTRLYDGEITYWDARFAHLMEELKRRGLYDDLTIVVTADHGEELADHGGFWHGTTLYDELVHVPLFVKLPRGRRAGTVVRHWVQSIDLMPSLLEAEGVDVPEGVQGGSYFEGSDRIYAEESQEGNVLESVRQRRGTDELKLITANPGNPRGLSPVELYRVDDDPAEQHDLAESAAGDVQTMTEALVEAGRAADHDAVRSQTVEMDEEAAQRLRNLGYAGDH